jgi:hypothetical protein
MKVFNVLLLVLFASSTFSQGGSIKRVLEPVGGVVPGQYVVVLDEGVEPHGLVNGLKKSGQAEILHEYKIINGFAVRMNINALENALKHIEGVTIYDDPIVTAITVQDPAGSWGLDRVDQRTGGWALDEAYSYYVKALRLGHCSIRYDKVGALVDTLSERLRLSRTTE